MSEREHTPGPWEYRPRKHDDWGWVRGPKQQDGDQPLVACARSGRYETDAELAEHRKNKTDPYEANARLIAAAPDLLRIVKIFLGGNEKFQVAIGGNPIAVDKMLDEASAVVAKAEGRSLTPALRPEGK